MNSGANFQVLENQYVRIELVNGILVAFYKEDVRITGDIARLIAKERYEFFNRKSYPALVFDQGIKMFDKEARDFFSSPEGNIGISAGALVLHSVFSKVIGNFFLKVNKPPVPSRIFTEEAAARKWLEQFLTQ